MKMFVAKRKRVFKRSILWIFLLVYVFAAGFPLVWMFLTSIKPPSEIFTYPPTILPQKLTLANYVFLFTHTSFLTYFKNSLIIAGSATLLGMFVATFGAYSLARFRFWGKEFLARIVFVSYMVPGIITIIPLYQIFLDLGLTDSYFGLIIAYITITLPFSLWLLRSFFESIPIDLEEAARVDGAGRFRAFIDAVFPQALPGIIATAIYSFTAAFNEYLFALILISNEALKTVPLGITGFASAHVVDWGLITAAATATNAPMLILFTFIQKWLIQGWGTGSVKG